MDKKQPGMLDRILRKTASNGRPGWKLSETIRGHSVKRLVKRNVMGFDHKTKLAYFWAKPVMTEAGARAAIRRAHRWAAANKGKRAEDAPTHIKDNLVAAMDVLGIGAVSA